ncbi:MAG: tetratricopeptide repeat protein [Vicinamibacterales bacterium]
MTGARRPRWAAALAAVLLAPLAAGPACRRAPEPAEAKAAAIKAGDAALADAQYGSAADAYARAVAVDPLDGDLRFKLARALESSARWDDAAREAMRAADLMPGNAEARLMAARLVLVQGRFDDSVALTNGLLNDRPDDPALLILWATGTAKLINTASALMELGPTGGQGTEYERACARVRPRVAPEQDRAAEAALRRAVSLAPESTDAKIALVNYLWATRRAEDAGDLLRTLADALPGHALLNEAAGHFFLARGQAEAGERYLENAAKAGSFGRAARLVLLDRYLATGRYDGALAMLDGLGDTPDEGGALAAKRATATLGLGRLEDARQQLDALIARYPTHARALALLARLELQSQHVDAAVDAGRKAIAADPGLYDGHLALAQALDARGDADSAFDEFTAALRVRPGAVELAPALARLGLATGHHEAALVHATDATTANPGDRQARLLRVEAFIRTGDYRRATAQLARDLAATPASPDVLRLQALLAAAQGRFQAARAAYRSVLAVAPGSMAALTDLVDLELSQGDLAEARRQADAAVAAHPADAGALRLRALVQRAGGDTAAAASTVTRALALKPSDTDSALLLAQLHVAAHRPEEARPLLEEVLERRPSSLAAQLAMGDTLEQLGRDEEAQRRYQTTLAEHPDSARAAARFALLVLARGGSATLALGVLTEARRVIKDDAELDDALGWVYVQMDQPAAALPLLERAVRARADDPAWQYHLGVAYARAGRVSAARTTLTRALGLASDFPERARAEAELAALSR